MTGTGTADTRDPATDPACIFCAIVAGRAPAYQVGANATAIAILDIQPLSRGHCLVIPTRHAPFWYDLTDAEVRDLFSLARTTALALRDRFGAELVTMYARGRRIPHTHIFLVPTVAADPLDRYFNALEGFQEAAGTLAALRSPEALAGTAAYLRETSTGRGEK